MIDPRRIASLITEDPDIFNYHCVRGLISDHSVDDLSSCPALKVLGEYTEHYPNGEKCQSRMIEHEGGAQAAISEIQPNLKAGHFALLFDDNQVYVLFRDKTHVLKNATPWVPGQFEALCAEGKSRGIDKMYFDGIREAISRWF